MLADLAGQPLVVRVAQRALLSNASRVLVATDSEEIAHVTRQHNIETLLTLATHPTGTDRLAECAGKLGLADDEMIVNVQGDEPLIEPALINQVADALAEDGQAAIATCAATLTDPSASANPNVVKVVRDLQGRALYFSRSSIPFIRNSNPPVTALHHIGIYAYRVAFLRAFPTLSQGVLEQAESLEQLRALEHGFKICVSVTDRPVAGGVDTEADLQRVRRIFEENRPARSAS
jgi:3-deoxy-manno-octulosonate cytidylyltransferase (CMP-KDO synthetase)